ncbi:MAG: GntR family transcriptional regulator [Acidimicrobiia bacterium]
MLIRIDEQASQPIFTQIAAQIRRAIADGTLPPGRRIPPARELAEGLGVNMHTVLRAYNELRDEGLVEMRRRRGVTVREDAAVHAPLSQLARELVTHARRVGLDDQHIRDLLEAHL